MTGKTISLRSQVLETRLFTVVNLSVFLLVASVFAVSFYLRMGLSSEFAYINLLFYVPLILLAAKCGCRIGIGPLMFWLFLLSLFLVTERTAGSSFRDVAKFSFLYCLPLLVCQLRFGSSQDQRRALAKAIIRTSNAFVFLVFGILVLDCFTGSACMAAISNAAMKEMSGWVSPEISSRHVSIWGHYLSTAGFYLVFYYMNIAYERIVGESLVNIKLLYVVATLGILSTGGKTAIVIYLLSVIWLNTTSKDAIKNAIALSVFLGVLYFVGAFDVVLDRFGASDLSSGRNGSVELVLSYETPRIFCGYGEGYTAHFTSFIDRGTVSMFSEYSLLTLAFKFGLVFAVGAAFLILLPSIKTSVATGNYSILFLGILMLTYFSTFNGMANIPDVYHVMALFCLVLNLLGERTSKNDSVDSAVSDVIAPKGL